MNKLTFKQLSQPIEKETNTELCCPKCKGTSGYKYEMTETHQMGGNWGHDAEAGDSGYYVKQSLISCHDCDAKFQWSALVRKGLVHGMYGRR